MEMDISTTSRLLEEWGFSQYVDHFRKNKITCDLLRIINEDQVSRLIPDCVGDVISLLIKRNAWLKEEVQEQVLGGTGTIIREAWNNVLPTADWTQDPHLSIMTTASTPITSPQYSASASITTSPQHLSASITSPQYSSASITSPQYSSASINSPHFQDTFGIIQETIRSPVSTISHSSTFGSGSSMMESLSTGSSCSVQEQSTNQIIAIGPNYVRKVLSACQATSSLLTKQVKELSSTKERRPVSREIISSLLEPCPSRPITSPEFERLAKQIVELFPSESEKTWYSPYAAGTDISDKIVASGLLYESYRSKRQNFKRNNRLILKKRRLSSQMPSSNSKQSSSASAITKESFANMESPIDGYLEWLQEDNIADLDTVKTRWQETSDCRIQCLKEGKPKYQSIIEYFSTFKVLRSPDVGACLMEMDFEAMYPGKSDSLFSGLISVRPKIIELANKKLKESTDKEASHIIKTLLEASVENIDASNAQCLLLLPYIADTPAQKTVKKVSWKPSRAEVGKGFLMHVPSQELVESTRLTRIEFLMKKKRPILPYVMYVGEFNAPECVLVVIDDIMYSKPNISDGVGLCFKIFFSCHAHYPEEANHIWLTIQRGLYQISTPHDRLSSPCKNLLSNLGFKV